MTVISYYARMSSVTWTYHLADFFPHSSRLRRSDPLFLIFGFGTNVFFAEAGWIGRQAILMTGINSVIYVLSTLPPCVSRLLRWNYLLNLSLDSWYLVDRWGRRTILLSGAVVVCPRTKIE